MSNKLTKFLMFFVIVFSVVLFGVNNADVYAEPVNVSYQDFVSSTPGGCPLGNGLYQHTHFFVTFSDGYTMQCSCTSPCRPQFSGPTEATRTGIVQVSAGTQSMACSVGFPDIPPPPEPKYLRVWAIDSNFSPRSGDWGSSLLFSGPIDTANGIFNVSEYLEYGGVQYKYQNKKAWHSCKGWSDDTPLFPLGEDCRTFPEIKPCKPDPEKIKESKHDGCTKIAHESPSDQSYFLVYEPEEEPCNSYLTAIAIDVDGNFLNRNGKIVKNEENASRTSPPGEHHTCGKDDITVPRPKVSGYKFKGWSDSRVVVNPKDEDKKDQISRKVGKNKHQKVYAVYEKTCSASLTGYAILDKSGKYLTPNGVETTNQGSAWNQTSSHANCSGKNRTVTAPNKLGDYKFKGWSAEIVKSTSWEPSDDMKPASLTRWVPADSHLIFYAVYTDDITLGCKEFAPASYMNSSPTSGTTSAVAKVKNIALGDGWKDETYGKPTDQVEWLHCYFPGVQTTAKTEVTVANGSTSLHGSHTVCKDTENKYKKLYEFFLSGSKRWSNTFEVNASNLRSPNLSESYDIGDSRAQEFRDKYTIVYGAGNETMGVKKNKAGKELVETGVSGFPRTAEVKSSTSHSWECDSGEKDENDEPIMIKYKHTTTYKSGKADGGAKSNSAKVKVPYNFYNTAKIELKRDRDYVYAGETAEIDTEEVYTLTKPNNVTRGTYATHVDDAEVRLISFVANNDPGLPAFEGIGSGKGYNLCNVMQWVTVDGKCAVGSERSNATLNSSGNLGLNSEAGTIIATEVLGRNAVNVYDVPAGRWFCVALAVYPATSGSDTNMLASGSNSWYVSAPSCKVVAKKPSLQVWGAGMYTSGNVMLSEARKRIVDGKFPNGGYRVRTGNDSVVFSSWVDQHIVANGKVANYATSTSLASGASAGGAGSTSRTVNGLSGSHEASPNFCIRSPLTMPNKSCSTINPPGGTSGSMLEPKTREDIIARFQDEGSSFTSHRECSIAGLTVPLGETHVYNGNCNKFEINGNINYASNAFGSMSSIPKVIIIAQNININCNVNTINAVLVAHGNINTCYDDDAPNSRRRSNPLKINGAVITNRMYAERTYGAATGVNSGEPAEVVNYDTTLYLWGAYKAESSKSGKLDVVYQTELAPRV